MDWRKLERELIDIFRNQDVELDDDGGDTVVIQRGLVLFSVTALAKELAYRGIE